MRHRCSSVSTDSRRASATASTSSPQLPTDCDQTKGLNAAQDILTANPGRHRDLRRLWSADPRRHRGGRERRQEALCSSASTPVPDEVKAIVAGTELASVAQFPAKMGSMGAQAALDAVNGKTVEANIDTGTEMVTKDNAADFGG